jgi:hypothetical protein
MIVSNAMQQSHQFLVSYASNKPITTLLLINAITVQIGSRTATNARWIKKTPLTYFVLIVPMGWSPRTISAYYAQLKTVKSVLIG